MSNAIIVVGWLFFAGWSAVLATLSGIAFGRDLLPEKLRTIQPQNPSTDNSGTRSVTR